MNATVPPRAATGPVVQSQPMRGLAALTATVAVMCVVVGGCSRGGDADDGTATVESDLDLYATLERSTLFETQRALRLTVSSDRSQDLEIGRIQLDTPLFAAVPPQDRDASVRAGGRVAMPLPFGEPRCDAASDGRSVLVAEVDGDEVRIALDERPSTLLAALHRSECAAVAVLADVELRFGDVWEATDERTVAGELEVAQRRDGVTATVEEVLGNVIFTVSSDESSPVVEVNDEQPSAGAGVAITAARCDPHALIEYKRTFTFTASVRVGDDEPIEVDVAAEGTARRALEDLLTSCIG